MELSRLSVKPHPSPIVNAVGGIRRLLYLGDHKPRADGMNESRRKKIAFSLLRRNEFKSIFKCVVFYMLGIFFPRDRFFEAEIKPRALFTSRC